MGEDESAYTRQLEQFRAGLDASWWHATVQVMVGEICLRIERIDGQEASAARPAIEVCRATFAEAAESARRYLTSQALG